MPDSEINEQLDPAATDETSDNARDGARKRRDPNEPSAVVGLGASAGGVAVLQQFFSDMSPESGLAFVVVMHLSPEHESNLANILQSRTPMPVVQVMEPTRVRPNCIYVIPPGKLLSFEDSTLHLAELQHARTRRTTIDLFFRTLAQAYGQRAVCIVLSGTDSDGVIGLKHIRAQGGVTIAQDPQEAEHDSMPVTAISTGMVDWVLPVARMPAKLLEFVQNEHAMRLPPEIEDAEETDVKVEHAPGGETVSDETRDAQSEKALNEVLAVLRAQTTHDFAHYKRATVLRRIARRMQVNSIESIPLYLEFLRRHPSEARALLQDLLIGVTHFFRDHDAFAALEAQIPQLFAGKKREDQVRVWVAGCSTGEEAYSIAMLLTEYADKHDASPKIQVFASDIDQQAIHDARDGLYPATIEADVSYERLRHFFTKDQGRYRVRKELRDRVLFAAHDVLNDAPFSRVELVSCRNLLIYLTEKAQDQVFDTFHFALRPGGLLFIGSAEGGQVTAPLFSPIDSKHRLYVRRSVPRPVWKIPQVPLRALDPTKAVVLEPRPRRLPALSSAGAETASLTTTHTTFDRQERRAVLFGELHLKLLEEYGPPSAVVNEAHDLVHLSGSAGRYLQFVAGEPSANVVALVRPELRTELRTALFRAAQTREAIKGSAVAVEIGADKDVIAVEVRPIRQDDSESGYFLIFFNTLETAAPTHAPANAAPPAQITIDLENEVHFLKQQLSSTIEQYEATSEELKASNEELQAINEEMRSATEELETSKEELQSVNEELITVNSELKSSVEELSRSNTDLNNLMASTDIGTIFLDRALRIERFTPSAQKIFNLIPSDSGRPITDITHRLSYQGFIADAETVLTELRMMEREVQMGDAKWYLARIAPYRTAEDRIAGVVVTFIDITARKTAQDELRASEERMRRAFEIQTVGIIYFKPGGAILQANEAFLRMSGYTRADLETGRLTWQDMTPAEFGEVSRLAVQQLTEQGNTTPYEKQYIRKDGTRFWALFAATRLSGDEAVEFIIDITETKRVEDALRESQERFRTLSNAVPQLIWTNNSTGEAVYFNDRWYEFTGLTYEESRGPGWQAVVHPDDAVRAISKWRQKFAAGELFEAEFRLRRKDGTYRWHIARNVPVRDETGAVTSWFGSTTDVEDFRQADEALRQSEERFRLLVEGAPDYAMFLLDTENNITYWSTGAHQVFGWTPEEAIGRKGSMIFTREDLEKGEDQKELETALHSGSAPDRRWHVRKDGSRLWLDGFMRRLDHEEGTLRGFAKVAREATDQKMAEEKLREAHDMLEQRVHDRTKELQAMNETLEAEMMQRHRLESEILQVTERERARISQDLHDSLCQELTATAFLMKSRAKSLGRTDPEAGDALSEAAEAVNRNAGLARDLARGLHPLELGPGGLVAALRELASRTSQTAACRCECPRSLRVPNEAVALNLYRIAQEAVTNALKHAKPNDIVICIAREEDEIVLSVKDDGTPRRTRRKGGMGIQMMQYRADVSGGKLTIETNRGGKGTKVTCRVPAKQ